LKLILASASPQRRKLLGDAGYGFEVVPSAVAEIANGPEPAHIALLNAEAKARAVSAEYPEAVVLGADTVVDVEGIPLGQPADPQEAEEHLRLLSGSRHEVHTGVCVISGEVERSGVASTRVQFRALTDEEMLAYVAKGEWQGRAGGYAIQESGDAFVTEVNGDFDNVIGLPMRLVAELLPDSVQPA
jgi:septum formation protein